MRCDNERCGAPALLVVTRWAPGDDARRHPFRVCAAHGGELVGMLLAAEPTAVEVTSDRAPAVFAW